MHSILLFILLYHLGMQKVTLVCPSNQTVALHGNASSKTLLSWLMPQVVGDSSDDVKISCSVANVSEFSIGTTQVSCNATKYSDVLDTCVFSVIVYGKLEHVSKFENKCLQILDRGRFHFHGNFECFRLFFFFFWPTFTRTITLRKKNFCSRQLRVSKL